MGKRKEFLENYLNATSPTGQEDEGQKIWLDRIKPYVDEVYTDIYGTAVGVINPDAKYKVMIEAHADEIGWTVVNIRKDGYLRVVRNGGSDEFIAPGTNVQILGEDGIVKGRFGGLAIHERKGDLANYKPKVGNLWVDIDVSSKEEAEELGVIVGSILVYDTKFVERRGNYISRALDNRIGGYMIAEVVRRIHKEGIKLDFGLYVVNAVQEEIGLCGAEMIATSIKPNVAIVTDVTHDTSTPLMNPENAGDVKCGKGPVLFRGADIQRNLNKLIEGVANKNDIKFQRATYNGNSGTDTGAIYRAGGGVASQLISLPLKYMHTTVETVNTDDVKQVINLIYQSVLAIEDGQDFRYLKV